MKYLLKLIIDDVFYTHTIENKLDLNTTLYLNINVNNKFNISGLANAIEYQFDVFNNTHITLCSFIDADECELGEGLWEKDDYKHMTLQDTDYYKD